MVALLTRARNRAQRPFARLLPGAARILAVGGLTLLPAAAVSAQQVVTLPDTSLTTPVTVDVSEQARILVPAGISFNVTDISRPTSSGQVAVLIDQIVLSNGPAQLRVSLRANAASFAPPEPGAASWTAADVSWGVSAWTAATGAAGVLSDTAFTELATCHAPTTECSSGAIVFQLGPRPSVQRSGAHSLDVTWKLESIGS